MAGQWDFLIHGPALRTLAGAKGRVAALPLTDLFTLLARWDCPLSRLHRKLWEKNCRRRKKGGRYGKSKKTKVENRSSNASKKDDLRSRTPSSSPAVKARADWLLPPLTLALGTMLGFLAQPAGPAGPRLLNALLLGVTAIGTFKAGQTPFKAANGATNGAR